MIRQEDGKWFLYTRDGSKRLGGPYDSETAAQERELQVERFAKAHPDGLMVALVLPLEVAQRLEVPGGLPATELHCTLAYCGRLQDLPADAVDRAKRAAGWVATEFGPVLGLLGGVGRFNGSASSDWKSVLHATLDAPLLGALREAVVRELEAGGLPVRRDHGFDPHVTLRYEDQPAESGPPLPAIATTPVVFQALTVAAGPEHSAVPLIGTRLAKSEESVLKALTAAEQADLDAETERIRENKKTSEARKPHPFKSAEWTHPNGHPRCLVCGGEEPITGECMGVEVEEVLQKMAARYQALLGAGVPAAAACLRLGHEALGGESALAGWEAGALVSMAVDLAKASREHSREYLEAAWELVQERCPPWVVHAIRASALPRAGARARARRNEEARTSAPNFLERLALAGVQPQALVDVAEGELRTVWQQLGRWHGGAKKRGEGAESLEAAARHFAAEMKRRGLAVDADDLVRALEATPPPAAGGEQPGATAKVLKGRDRPEKQIIYGVVLDPYVVDAHDDWIPPAEVEETAHAWMEKYRAIPFSHPNDPAYRPDSQARPVESWMEPYPSAEDYKAAMAGEPHTVWRRQFGEDAVHSGTWIIGVRLPDALWAAYKRGEIGAFSIEGFGVRTPSTRKAMPKVTVVDLVPAA